MEGSLTKLCRKVAKRRYFWLFSDCLVYGIPVGGSSIAVGVSNTTNGHHSLPATSATANGTKQYKFRKILPLLNSKFVNLTDDPSSMSSAGWLVFACFNILSGQPSAFQIVTAHKSFIVFASTEEQKAEWLRAHSTAMDIIASRGTAVKVKTGKLTFAIIFFDTDHNRYSRDGANLAARQYV